VPFRQFWHNQNAFLEAPVLGPFRYARADIRHDMLKAYRFTRAVQAGMKEATARSQVIRAPDKP
jgi:hypothetical protein